MARIRINPAGVMGSSAMAESAKRVVGTVSAEIGTVRWGIDSRILDRYQIGTRLGKIQSTVSHLEGDIRKLCGTVNRGAALYVSTENSIVVMGREVINDVTVKKNCGGNAQLLGVGAAVSGSCGAGGLFSVGGGHFGGGGGGSRFPAGSGEPDSAAGKPFDCKLEKKGSVSAWSNRLDKEKDGWHLDLLKAGYSASVKPELGVWEVEDYEPKIEKGSNSEEAGFPKKEISIAAVKTEAAIELNVFEAELTGSGKHGEYNLDVKCGTAEAHGEISAGIYTYDVNGVTLAAPAIEAKVGASYSALSVAADGKLGLGEGYDTLGVYGEGSIDVQKVSVEAKAGLSLFSKDGRIDPNVYLGLSGEELLFEAKGTVGLSVLGVDAGITGGVNFGVGAHAKAGFQDGKIMLDVGASLGVGVNLGFEVDVGGMVDTVCGTVEDAWNGVEKAWEGVENAWNGFVSWFD